jgi:hypothetical protein
VPPGVRDVCGLDWVRPEGPSDAGGWLHTHGLLRCRTPELEMLDVPRESLEQMADGLLCTAGLFVRRGPPPADRAFRPHGALTLTWLPWQQGIRKVRRGVPGATKQDRDGGHSAPSAILFSYRDGFFGRRYRCPAWDAREFEADVLIGQHADVTEWQRRSATQQFPRYMALFERFGPEEGWSFPVKLGYATDQSAGAATEWMWFEVHAITPEAVDATLLNTPHYVSYLSKGQRRTHSLELMADWAIHSPYGVFGPDTAVELEWILGDAAPQV